MYCNGMYVCNIYICILFYLFIFLFLYIYRVCLKTEDTPNCNIKLLETYEWWISSWFLSFPGIFRHTHTIPLYETPIREQIQYLYIKIAYEPGKGLPSGHQSHGWKTHHPRPGKLLTPPGVSNDATSSPMREFRGVLPMFPLDFTGFSPKNHELWKIFLLDMELKMGFHVAFRSFRHSVRGIWSFKNHAAASRV